MARLVLDTNSLIQCISRRSLYHDLWLSFLDGRNIMCVTPSILDEYAEILEQLTSPKFAELALDVITNNPYTIFAQPFYNFHIITSDPDDDKFVDCAVASNAKFIVTEDSHFNVLKHMVFPVVEIINLDEIMRFL